MSLGMVTIGVLHFVTPDPFLRIMPDYLPAHSFLVQLSGVCEIAGGVGVLLPQTRRWAAWGLFALFLAVFPANLYMAQHGIQMNPAHPMPPWFGWARLPMQIPLLVWAWSIARDARWTPPAPLR